MPTTWLFAVLVDNVSRVKLMEKAAEDGGICMDKHSWKAIFVALCIC